MLCLALLGIIWDWAPPNPPPYRGSYPAHDNHFDFSLKFQLSFDFSVPAFKYHVPTIMEHQRPVHHPQHDDVIDDVTVFPSNKEVVVKYSGNGVLSSSVIGPNGDEDDVTIVTTETDTFSISFVPSQVMQSSFDDLNF